MNISLLKQLDAWIGRLLVYLLPAPSRSVDCSSPHSILLIRPGGIGDAVLLAPTITALKKRYPQIRLTVLAEKRNAGVFSLIPAVDQVLQYDVRREFFAALRLKPDITIDTEQYHRLSAVVARLTGAHTFIGFGTNERARLFHHVISYSHDDYEIESFFHLIAPFGLSPPVTNDTPFLIVPPLAQIRAKQLLASIEGHSFIVLFPGASIPERRWSIERFGQVAFSLAEQGHPIVVVGGAEDTRAGAAITRFAGGLNLAGQTTLTETAAILQQSALLVSGDSGLLHMGVGLGTPTVSLFGPGVAKKWAPRCRRHIVLNTQLPCSPCTKFGYTKPCPRQAECLQRINPEEVVEAALRLLANGFNSTGEKN